MADYDNSGKSFTLTSDYDNGGSYFNNQGGQVILDNNTFRINDGTFDNRGGLFSAFGEMFISTNGTFNNEGGNFDAKGGDIAMFGGTFSNTNGAIFYNFGTDSIHYALPLIFLNFGGAFDNSGGTIYLSDHSSFSNWDGTFINSSVGHDGSSDSILFDTPGLYLFKSSFNNTSTGEFNNSNGFLALDLSTFENSGTFINSGGELTQSELRSQGGWRVMDGRTGGLMQVERTGFYNYGTFDNSNGLVNAYDTFENKGGTFNNTNGTFNGNFFNDGGTFDNTNGTFSGYFFNGDKGTLKGSGTITDDLSIKSGIFQPEEMTIEGKFTLESNGELEFLNPGNTALLSVTGDVALEGGTISFGDLSTLTEEVTLIDVTSDSSLTINAALMSEATATVDSFDTTNKNFSLVQLNNDLILTLDPVLFGTSGNDTLTGTSSDEILNGLDGDDILRGNGGNDVLNGGLGRDIYYGGSGADTFVFDTSTAKDTFAEIIWDFESGVDHIQIDKSVFGISSHSEIFVTKALGNTYIQFGYSGSGFNLGKTTDFTLESDVTLI